MFTNRSTSVMLFGVIIGLCCGILIRNYQTLEIVKRCKLKPDMNDQNAFEIINMRPDETILNSQKNLLFVGVMTAKNFLQGRAKAVYDTWGKEVPGRIAFFSSQNSYSKELPVVALKGVDDRYPPQKKSFMMLYYMYEHFLDRFEWFARTDDDVYVNTRKLEHFLRSVDSSKPQFIGQAGKGNSEEFGLLSLEFDENFCMGGPGVILSRETLRRVAPHIPTCLKNLYSTHEDVEIGRCVQKFAGIPCTWNYEMQSILHHNSSGRYAFTGNLKSREIHRAITLHPVKKAPLMYRLHAYMQGLRAQEIRQEMLSLHRDIADMKTVLGVKNDQDHLVPGISIFSKGPTSKQYLGDPDILGVTPDLKKFRPLDSSEIQHWNFIAKNIYSADHSNPKRKFESALREGLDDIITEVMGKINNFSRQRGRVIEFRELLYGYTRVNSLYGQDMILDLLLIYKKYRGKKMTVPVRRHLYIQRAFSDIFIEEIRSPNELSMENAKLSLLSEKVKDLWNTGIGKISESLTLPETGWTKNDGPAADEKIVFILAMAGRFPTFLRFLQNYEEVCLKRNENTELLIVIFQDQTDLLPFYDELFNINEKYPSATINQITIKGNFSRGKALDIAARSNYVNDHDILFFIDVDIIFQQASLDRIRKNTIEHQQVYLPIVFSQYDPNRVIADLSIHPFPNVYRNLSYANGYFRQFGYGICAIYKSDILDPGIDGFNTDINGWGLEDVKFLERIVKLNRKSENMLLNTADDEPRTTTKRPIINSLSVFRSPDPTLVHIFHPIECDKNLDPAQYVMCLGTKANTLGSYKQIESQLIRNSTIISYLLTILANA